MGVFHYNDNIYPLLENASENTETLSFDRAAFTARNLQNMHAKEAWAWNLLSIDLLTAREIIVTENSIPPISLNHQVVEAFKEILAW